MVTGPANTGTSIIQRILHGEAQQLALPIAGPSPARIKLMAAAGDFAKGFIPKLGSSLLMKLGLPLVAASTPIVIHAINPDWEDKKLPGLLVGSAIGGVWGAMVGALIPRTGDGVKISRLRSAGSTAAGGVLIAAGLALASTMAYQRVIEPYEKAKDLAEERLEKSREQLEQVDEGAPGGTE